MCDTASHRSLSEQDIWKDSVISETSWSDRKDGGRGRERERERERESKGMKRSCAKHLVSALSLSPQKFQHNMFFFQPFGFACCIFSTLPSLMYGKDLCLGKITGTGLCFPREGSNGCTSLLCCGKGSVTLRSRELIKFHSQCGEEECRTEAHSTGQQSTAQYCKKPCDDAPHSKAQYNRVERHSEMHNKSKHNARTVQTPWHNRAQHGMTRHSAMQFKTIKEMLRIPHPNLLRWHGASENVLVLVNICE